MSQISKLSLSDAFFEFWCIRGWKNCFSRSKCTKTRFRQGLRPGLYGGDELTTLVQKLTKPCPPWRLRRLHLGAPPPNKIPGYAYGSGRQGVVTQRHVSCRSSTCVKWLCSQSDGRKYSADDKRRLRIDVRDTVAIANDVVNPCDPWSRITQLFHTIITGLGRRDNGLHSPVISLSDGTTAQYE